MLTLDYQRICKDKRQYKSLFGVDQTTYQKLIPEFNKNVELLKQSKSTCTKRCYGGGRKPLIFYKNSQLLLYILFFIRIYPTFDLAKLIFTQSRSQLHFWYELSLEALELTLKRKIELPAQRTKSLKELFTKIPSLAMHIIDATEQPINRPKYNEEFYYSGKKKCHSIKRQIIINSRKKIIGISNAVEGKKHDKRLAEESKYLLHSPPNCIILTDGGYEGLKHPKEMRHIKPLRKKPRKNLTQEQKKNNQTLSSLRVQVEHVICHLKYWNIFSNKLRYRKREYDDQISNIVGGLYNMKFE